MPASITACSVLSSLGNTASVRRKYPVNACAGKALYAVTFAVTVYGRYVYFDQYPIVKEKRMERVDNAGECLTYY
jgi:hypothetical protein